MKHYGVTLFRSPDRSFKAIPTWTSLSRWSRLSGRGERTPAPHACSTQGTGCGDDIPRSV
ncbi:MAG: hypothetical protein ACFFD2_17110 [Promethearchaeota archaeon]